MSESLNSHDLVREKLAQATEILKEFDVDLWLTLVRESTLQPDPTLELIFGGDVTWTSAFLISRSGKHRAIVGYFDADNVRSLGAYSEVVGYHHSFTEPFLQAVRELEPRTIAINYSQDDVAADGLTVGLYQTLQETLEGTPYADRLQSAEKLNAALRSRKSSKEIERVRHAVEITEAIFDAVPDFAAPGMTQRQIAAEIQARIDTQGLEYAWPRPYNPIVTCGPQSAIGHSAPGDVVLEPGHTLHIDLGIKKNDYCSDIQRMWYVLDGNETKAPPDVQHAFDTVLAAIRAGERALRPGVLGWQVDAAAREVVVQQGYPEYMHALGHLLGRTAHDGATVLGPRWERYAGVCELPVEAGNIFTLELHVNVPNRGVVSLEEDVLVTADGVEYLSTPQTALRYLSG